MQRSTFVTRKQRRKEERQAKKERRKHFHDRKLNQLSRIQHEQSERIRKSKDSADSDADRGNASTTTAMPHVQRQDRLCQSGSTARKRKLLAENKNDDRIIKSLEKRMRLNKVKKKSLPRSFVDDGLDYILELLDNPRECKDKDGSSANLSQVHSNAESGGGEDEVDSDASSRPDRNDDGLRANSDISVETDCKHEHGEDNRFDGGGRRDETDEDSKVGGSEPRFAESVSDAGNAAPSVDTGVSEPPTMLSRQIKGLLNRLSDATMQFVSTQIEELYSKNPRNDVNHVLTRSLLDQIAIPSPLPERLLMEQAALVAVLHGNVGTEVGAYILQSTVVELHSILPETGKNSDDKRCLNLIVFLSYMYAFKIVHSLLVFDTLQHLISRLSFENELDLIVTILKTVGFGLRKDDPTSLWEVVVNLQAKVASLSELHDQSRVQFLMDVVKCVQNNNPRKIPNYDPDVVIHVQKVLRSILRKGHHVQELRISSHDLLDSNRKGRWWIVGSAWTESDTLLASKGQGDPVDLNDFSGKLLELAHKQRMNSSVRKKIFCVVMSSEDFADAAEKLIRLGAKLHREVIHVVFYCCLREKTFNPFYAHLLHKLCIADRCYQMALKFAIWDVFKELGTKSPSDISRLSRLLIHLLVTDSISIVVLKAFNFAEMDGMLVSFLRRLFVRLFIDASEESCRAVFRRLASPSAKLRLLREGLKLFLRHFLLEGDDMLSRESKELVACRVKMVEEFLSVSNRKMF